MFIQRMLSRQLRHPDGFAGILTAILMDRANREMYQLLLSECMPVDVDTILEAGFGSGRQIPAIISLADNLSYSGIDTSRSMVSMASRENRKLIKEKRVELHLADIASIPYPDSTFNRVLTVNTIYFWTSPGDVIKELLRVLKPGGTITIGANSKDEMLKQGYNSKYFSFWNRQDIENLLQQNGLRIVSSFYKKLKIEDCIGVVATK